MGVVRSGGLIRFDSFSLLPLVLLSPPSSSLLSCSLLRSTGSHARTRSSLTLPRHPQTYANRITLVTPLGEIKKLQRGDDLFRAAGAGLGAVGCVTEVEWELVEAFGLEVTMERIKLGEYLEDGSGKKLYDLAKSEEYVKVRFFSPSLPFILPRLSISTSTERDLFPPPMQIWHFPHTLPFPLSHSDTILWRARRVPLPPPSPPPSLSDKLYKALANLLHGFCILVTLYLFPRLQGYVNGVQYWLAAWRLPRRETKRGYEAMEMDCGYSRTLVFSFSPLLLPPAVFFLSLSFDVR